MISAKGLRRLEKRHYTRIRKEYEDWLRSLTKDEAFEHESRLNKRLAEIGLGGPSPPRAEDLSDEVRLAYLAEIREYTRTVWLAGRVGQSNAATIEEWRAYQAEGHPAGTTPGH